MIPYEIGFVSIVCIFIYYTLGGWDFIARANMERQGIIYILHYWRKEPVSHGRMGEDGVLFIYYTIGRRTHIARSDGRTLGIIYILHYWSKEPDIEPMECEDGAMIKIN